MPFVIEFGIRGGAHVDNIIIPTAKLAKKLVESLYHVFTASNQTPPKWYIFSDKGCPRESWMSATHFIAISRLNDERNQGAASAKLWKKD